MENKTVLLGLDRFLTSLYLCIWFIMKSFRTTSPRHKMNQFLPLNSLCSWVCIRCFPTSTTAIRSAVDTITATMITALFQRHVVRQLIAADTCLPLVSEDVYHLNEHDSQRSLLLFRRHILSSAMNVRFTLLLT